MSSNDTSWVSVFPREQRTLGSDLVRTVVWVCGDHDISTRAHLSASLAHAARAGDADVIVDLSGVTFMDASTIGALVGAHNRLRASSRSLSVRDPSDRARRVLDLCGLGRLIEHATPEQRPAAPALGSWVDVPASDRDPDSAHSSVTHEAPFLERARAVARRRGQRARSMRQPRAVS